MSEALIVRRGGSGGAGGGLNFKVVQYTETPTGTAAENTIAVVTDTPISSWVMSAEQPEGVDGMVWLEASLESDVAFFADKKQLLKIYPKFVRQYTNGTWARVNAYIYQGGWIKFCSDWNGELYVYGDQWETITGGWIIDGQTQAADTVTFQDQDIMIAAKANYRSVVSTANKIDTTGYNTLYFRLSGRIATLTFMQISTEKHGNIGNQTDPGGSVAKKQISSQTLAEETDFALDISAATEPVYVHFRQQNEGTVYIHKVWME